KSGLRTTEHRQQVLDILIEADHALTSSDIEERFVDIDRITLYRTLKSFEEKGIIHKVIDVNNVTKFALCIDECTEEHHHDHHVHFHCDDCGNTFCLEDVVVPKISLPSGYKVKNRSMLINGKCV